MGKYDYTEKRVCIGLDVHKKTYACVSICDGQIIKKDTMPADPKGLIAYIQNNFTHGKIETAYEAGFSGFHLHRELIKVGIKNRVIHPGSIEVAVRDRVKTDKRDAKKIAEQLAANRLHCIYIPTPEQEAKRSVSRLRNNIVKLRHQIGQKFKSLLFTQGLISGEDDTVICKKWLNKKLAEIKELNYPEGFYYTLEHYATTWIRFTEDLKKIKKDLLVMQTEEEKKLLSIYQSAPGIGELTALKLKDELGDMSQFSNEKQLFNYLGFTPTEYSSGENIRQGHISRQSRSMLRNIFVESAWIAVRKDSGLMEIYDRIAKTRGAKRAIVGIARRLAGRLRTCVRLNISYKITKESEKDNTPDLKNLIKEVVESPILQPKVA